MVFVHPGRDPIEFVDSEGDAEVVHTSLLVGEHPVRPLVQGDLHPVEPDVAPAGAFSSRTTIRPIELEAPRLGRIAHRNRHVMNRFHLRQAISEVHNRPEARWITAVRSLLGGRYYTGDVLVRLTFATGHGRGLSPSSPTVARKRFHAPAPTFVRRSRRALRHRRRAESAFDHYALSHPVRHRCRRHGRSRRLR
jgi:hypothetical protein